LIFIFVLAWFCVCVVDANVAVAYKGSAVGVNFDAAVSDTAKTAEWFESTDGGATWHSLGYTGNSLSIGFFVNGTNYDGRKYRVKASNYDDQFVTSNAATLTVVVGS